MIFDIILVAIFIILIIVNVWRGFAKSLASILSAVGAYFGATALGGMIANFIYDSLIQPAVTKAVKDAVVNVSNQTADGVVSALPTWLTGLMNISAEDLTKLLQQPISEASGSIAETVNTAIRPIAIGIITALATVILFLLLIIILRKLITRPIVLLFRFPILIFVNRLLGAVIGFIDAFLLVSMLAYLTKLIIVNASPQSSWFNESTIYNSFIFYHFYSGNIFSWISSLITGIKI